MRPLLLNIKTLFPYLLLIGIYFLFINIEAKNERNNFYNNKLIREEKDYQNRKRNRADINRTISIPVIPFEEK